MGYFKGTQFAHSEIKRDGSVTSRNVAYLGAWMEDSPNCSLCVSFYRNYDGGNQQGLYFGRWANGVCQVQKVASGFNEGYHSPLSFDSAGDPRILYYDGDVDDLKSGTSLGGGVDRLRYRTMKPLRDYDGMLSFRLAVRRDE
jgi:hypothetical protein